MRARSSMHFQMRAQRRRRSPALRAADGSTEKSPSRSPMGSRARSAMAALNASRPLRRGAHDAGMFAADQRRACAAHDLRAAALTNDPPPEMHALAGCFLRGQNLYRLSFGIDGLNTHR